MRTACRLMSAAVLLIAITALAGGWATVTVKNLPDYFVAGRPAEIRFLVRQHGVTPMEGVSPAVEATSARGQSVKSKVSESPDRKGEFITRLTLPHAGEWTIRIASGWNTSLATLMPVMAIAPDSKAPAPLTDTERGKRLFASKACITCHVNREIGENSLSFEVGPELTGRTFSEEYLKKLLTDPERVGRKMPNQELKEPEIRALVAFINRQR